MGLVAFERVWRHGSVVESQRPTPITHLLTRTVTKLKAIAVASKTLESVRIITCMAGKLFLAAFCLVNDDVTESDVFMLLEQTAPSPPQVTYHS